MRLALDTNRYVDAARGMAEVTERLRVASLRRQGTPIPINDVWVAALVLQHGLTLYARDRHFDHLPQIPRV